MLTNLAGGTYTLDVRAIGTNGTVGPTTSTTFTVATAVGTSLDVTLTTTTPTTVPSSWAAFSWTAPGAQCFRAGVDDADLSDNGCGSANRFEQVSGLSDGPHVLRVQARSAGGSFGPVLEVPFTVAAGPTVTIVSNLPDPVPSQNAIITWTARRWIEA